MPKLTPYKRHKIRWFMCQKCKLSTTRKKVVLLRASKIPAPVLFIGEAPGESEDVIGFPFVGPAGKLLDQMIAEAGLAEKDYAFTNLIGCIPRDVENGGKLSKPPEYAIKACSSRLVECVILCKPSLIVWVGSDPKKYGPKILSKFTVPKLHIIHPAAILRMDISQQGLAIQRTVVAIRDKFEEL